MSVFLSKVLDRLPDFCIIPLEQFFRELDCQRFFRNCLDNKHKRITTTVAKAKALKKFVEPLITKSKEDTTNSRRVVFSNLQDKIAVTELFKEISVKIADRPGGYTRIIKTGNRLGDNAEMCFIELVDYNENMAKEKVAKKATRTRRSKKAAEAAPAAVEAPATEAPKAEEPKAESAE